jgi:Xaa-Pro aminopeptidase
MVTTPYSGAAMTEREIKRARLEAVLDARGLDELVLRDPANLAWYLGGARVHVVPGDPIAEVTVGRAGEELRTTVIEAPRLCAEELGDHAPPLRAVPWWEPLDPPTAPRATAGAPARGSDRPRGGELDVAGDLMAARSALTNPEIERYRALSRDTAAATGAALRDAAATDSEFALGGRAARHLFERGVEPVVLLVAGARRLALHRHPLPTSAPLGERAMLVVCGRRHGLVCAVTRMRAFTPLSAAERDRYAALLAVEAAYLDATRRGARIGAIVEAGAAAYAAHGFAADEWHNHHQGGPTGYTTRDYLASPSTGHAAVDRQAFAWNPSGGGFKVEDTVLIAGDALEVLSPDPDWPAVAVAGRQRPDVLA